MASLEQACAVAERLERAGYRAVLVGGCVRDLLLGRPVHDWDIATSALPEQVLALFERCVPTGLKHGTVTVLEQGVPYEITTFRADGVYLDGRRPEQVRFVPRLEEDLKRRDFTVNAMAMDVSGAVFDPENGRADLARRRIACVGDPDTRFGEDALRMLRALRFSAQLDFVIAPETLAAVARNAAQCEKLSAERVCAELEKTLLSPRPQVVAQMIKLGLLASFGLHGGVDLSHLASLPAERTVRWAGLLQLTPGADLERLRLDKKTVTRCRNAVQAYLDAPTALQWRQMACSYGWETAQCVAALNGRETELKALHAEKPCVSLSQLAVCGSDFPELSGPQVGRVLRRLLAHVLEHPRDNERETLLSLARRDL